MSSEWEKAVAQVKAVRDIVNRVEARTLAAEEAVRQIREGVFAPEPSKSPGDELAVRVAVLSDNLRTGGIYAAAADLAAALDDYRSRRANEPTDEHLRTAGVPDEKKIARFLLDTLTSGALGWIIAMTRDALPGLAMADGYFALRFTKYEIDNLRANLRALGEDLP